MRNILGSILGILVAIGVLKGFGDADLTGGQGIGEIAMTIVNGVADLTIYLVPTVLDAIDGVLT